MTAKVRIESGMTPAKVGSVRLPKRFAVHIHDDDEGRPNVSAEFEVRNGQVFCRAVRLEAREREVGSSDLAAIRLPDLRDLAVRHLVFGDVHEVAPGEYLVSPRAGQDQQRRAAREVSRRRSTLDLARVADVYRANVGAKPTLAVADEFGVAHRTAALYVKRAREAGLMGAAIPGKAGEQ